MKIYFIVALETILLVATAWCAFLFVTAAAWSDSFGWWAATMVCLLNFWVLGVHWTLRYFVMAFGGVALIQQFSNHITTSHLVFGLGAILFTIFLCRYQLAAAVVWSAKTIIFDWVVCALLIVIASCIDMVFEQQYLLLTLSYFFSSNFLGVGVMKGAEKVMRWRSPSGSPRVKYVHNLAIPIPVIPSLHMEELLVISWTLVFILLGKAEYFLSLPNGGGVAKWQLMAATGFWGSLLAYMCPFVADKNPVPYYTPRELAFKRQQS